MRHKLDGFSHKAQRIAGSTVDPSKKVVFDQMISDANRLPEMLGGVVERVAILPQKVEELMHLVLENPDTDIAPITQEIRQIFTVDPVLGMLHKIRDDASAIVAQVKKSMTDIASFAHDAPGDISSCFEPPCPLYAFFDKPQGQGELEDAIGSLSSVVTVIWNYM